MPPSLASPIRKPLDSTLRACLHGFTMGARGKQASRPSSVTLGTIVSVGCQPDALESYSAKTLERKGGGSNVFIFI